MLSILDRPSGLSYRTGEEVAAGHPGVEDVHDAIGADAEAAEFAGLLETAHLL